MLQAGLYWVRLFDYFVASWPLILFAFLEMTVVLVYGVPRFARNITEMIGRSVSWFYKILWYTLVPLSTLVNYYRVLHKGNIIREINSMKTFKYCVLLVSSHSNKS